MIEKDIIADYLRWYKGSTIDDSFIQKVSEEIGHVLQAKLFVKPIEQCDHDWEQSSFLVIHCIKCGKIQKE